MVPWDFHERHPFNDITNFLGYPNHNPWEWRDNCPQYDGNPTVTVSHVLQFLKYVSHLKIPHEDVLIKLFMSSLQPKQTIFINNSSFPKSITSFTRLVNFFFDKWAIKTKKDELFISCLTKGLEKSRSRFLPREHAREEGEDPKELQDLGNDEIFPFDPLNRN